MSHSTGGVSSSRVWRSSPFRNVAGLESEPGNFCPEPRQFDALLTMDQGIEHQQEVAGRSLALVVIKASNNEYETLLPLIPGVVEALRPVDAGTVVSVTA